MPAWLWTLRRFRAEVLHADGLRPAFHTPDGDFRDDDPADPFAHHVVALLDGAPIATVRVLPLSASRNGVCERLLGTRALDRTLAGLDTRREETGEGSGWAVQPTHRGGMLGAHTLAAGTAVARELGLRAAIGAAGTRYGQLHRILAAGYRGVPGLPRIAVPALSDEVQMVHGVVDELRPSFQRLVTQLADLLRWETNSPTRVTEMTS